MQPMLATVAEGVPRGPEWVHEVKWDGMRVLADVHDGRLVLSSRTGRDVSVPGDGTMRLSLETSLPGVFAVGDVRSRSIKRVATAVGDGATVIATLHGYLAQHPAPEPAGATES